MTIIFACNKEDQMTETCPVEFEYIENTYKTNQAITQRWRFVGFENPVNKELQDPPCRNTPITITFADTVHKDPNPDFYNPYLMKGTLLINKFTTSYEVNNEQNEVEVSRVIASQVKGQSYVRDFENKVISGIQNVENFEIVGNTLRLKSTSTPYDLLFFAY